MELLRTFPGWGSLRLLFLAFAPAFIITAHAIQDWLVFAFLNEAERLQAPKWRDGIARPAGPTLV
jgi:hypothetical protein